MSFLFSGTPLSDRADWATFCAALPAGLGGIQTLNEQVVTVDTGGGTKNYNAATVDNRVTVTSQLHTSQTQSYVGRSFVYPGRKTRCLFTLVYNDLGDNTAAGEYYQGIAQSQGTSDPATDGNQGAIVVGVQKVANVAVGNWKLFCNLVDGTGNQTTNVVDTGVPIINGRRYSVELITGNGVATVFIDGLNVARSFLSVIDDSANTNTGSNLAQLYYANGSSATLITFNFEYLYTENIT